MMTVVAILFGIACFYMSFVRNAVMLGIGFFLLRMLGQGALSLTCSNVVNQWWVRRRGTVMGIIGIFTSMLGVGSFPSLLDWMIPRYGWPMTFIVLGVSVKRVFGPAGVLVYP